MQLGYSDEKVRRLTKEALNQGFNHFKVSFNCRSHRNRVYGPKADNLSLRLERT